MENIDKKDALEHLVVDSGAIIKGCGFGFHNVAKNFWTIPEVLDEIRDEKSRNLLMRLPFTLETKIPSDDAMAFVSDFARKCGDYSALSLTDLKLIALTYQLEVLEGGEAHLRKEPVRRVAPVASSSGASQKQTMNNAGSDTSSAQVSSLSDAMSHVSVSDKKAPKPIAAVEPTDAAAESAEEEEEEEDHFEGDLESEDDEDMDRPRVGWVDETDAELKAKTVTEYDIQGVDDFPSLGGAAPVTVEVAETKPAFSWVSAASKCANDVVEEVKKPVAPTIIKHAVRTERIEAAPVKPDFSTRSHMHDNGGGSRINVSSAHSSSLATVVTAEKAAEEDDGEGWAHPGNLEALKASGQIINMVNVNKKAPKKKKAPKQALVVEASAAAMEAHGAHHDDCCADATVGEEDADQGEFTVVTKKQSSNSSKKRKGPRKPTQMPVSLCKTGCATTDFTMQNVMMQIGLKIISISDGMQIREISQYVLRCGACFHVHYDMSRLFCSKCGNSMLQRIACSINERSGELKLHLKKDFHHNLKGLVYNLPKPNTRGRFEGEILLREDQLMSGVWKQKMVRVNKDVKSAFGADVTSDVGIQVNKSGTKIEVGLGKQNPNKSKNTGNRKKKSK